ncbi:MAG: amidase family protein [Geminicoccaceae bacterium]
MRPIRRSSPGRSSPWPAASARGWTVCGWRWPTAISRATAMPRRSRRWRRWRQRSVPGAGSRCPRRRARAAAFLITASEGGNLHLPELRRRAADFDPATRDRLLAGNLIPASWYLQAQRLRAWFRARMAELFQEVDVIVAPATPYAAPLLGQQTVEVDGEVIPVRPTLGVFTQPISFIGLPVLAVPLPRPGRLPIGVQLIAAPRREEVLFRVAAELERLGVVAAPRPA